MRPGPKQRREIPVCTLHPPPRSGSRAPSPGPARRERRGTTCVGRRPPATLAYVRRGGGQGGCSGGQVVGREAGHADLGTALAEDGELRAPVHPAAGQGRVPVLEVHGEVAVHLPAAPFPLDLRLHLRGGGQGAQTATCGESPSHTSPTTPMPWGPTQAGPATSCSTLPPHQPTPSLQLAALEVAL